MFISFTPKRYRIVLEYWREKVFWNCRYMHETLTHLKIKCSPAEAIERVTQGDDAARILQFLMRNYEEIFSKENQINLEKIVDLLGLDFDEIQKSTKLDGTKKILLNINSQIPT